MSNININSNTYLVVSFTKKDGERIEGYSFLTYKEGKDYMNERFSDITIENNDGTRELWRGEKIIEPWSQDKEDKARYYYLKAITIVEIRKINGVNAVSIIRPEKIRQALKMLDKIKASKLLRWLTK